jgi:uncharacterized protein
MPPTYANGKICYIEIPAVDVAESAEFYRTCFGWQLRKHEDGTIAFDDGVGEVSGMWVLGRAPAAEPGFIISIMVSDITASVRAVAANGGEIILPVDPNASEKIAHFRDPGGNVMGLYQERALARQ